jgi:hypothetical protein
LGSLDDTADDFGVKVEWFAGLGEAAGSGESVDNLALNIVTHRWNGETLREKSSHVAGLYHGAGMVRIGDAKRAHSIGGLALIKPNWGGARNYLSRWLLGFEVERRISLA